MSRTYSLMCVDCKEALWIAQGRPSDHIMNLYYGDQETMKKLEAFLFKHQDHTLRFVDDETLDDDIKEKD